jgi:hypothetical protein
MKQVFILCLLAVAIFVLGAPATFALTISPVRIEVSGDPGQSLRGELEIFNEQTDTKRFFSSFENFEPSGDTGSPHFIGRDGGLATWFSTENSFDIAPQQKKVIPYFINIPKDVEPGGYFAAIFWGEQDPGELSAGEVSIGGKLGVLILLRVNGDIDEAAGLTDFQSDNKVYGDVPVSFSYRFTNDGGDRVVPLGDIVIKNMFGAVTKSISANKLEGNVLPGSSRKFTALWGDDVTPPSGFFETLKHQVRNFHIGMYTAHLKVVYGTENQSANASYTFFLFPWHLLATTIGLLVILFVLLRQYNKWIIARSRA